MTRLTSISSVSAVLFVLALALAAPVQADMYVENGEFDDGLDSWIPNGGEVAPATVFGNPLAIFVEGDDHSRVDVVSSLTQTIDNLTDGVIYSISFDLFITTEVDISETDKFDAYFDGQNIYHWDNDADGEVDERITGTATAVGTDAILRFEFSSDGDYEDIPTSVELDNVEIAPVPLPGAALLGVLGLGMAGRCLRRAARRRS